MNIDEKLVLFTMQTMTRNARRATVVADELARAFLTMRERDNLFDSLHASIALSVASDARDIQDRLNQLVQYMLNEEHLRLQPQKRAHVPLPRHHNVDPNHPDEGSRCQRCGKLVADFNSVCDG